MKTGHEQLMVEGYLGTGHELLMAERELFYEKMSGFSASREAPKSKQLIIQN